MKLVTATKNSILISNSYTYLNSACVCKIDKDSNLKVQILEDANVYMSYFNNGMLLYFEYINNSLMVKYNNFTKKLDSGRLYDLIGQLIHIQLNELNSRIAEIESLLDMATSDPLKFLLDI